MTHFKWSGMQIDSVPDLTGYEVSFITKTQDVILDRKYVNVIKQLAKLIERIKLHCILIV